ncbi:hypothetical protein TcG_04571 [Trypanosoma cruzi]|uniref:Uncharacterized protein n=1 Tax=Trypanosoma cruzi TaxID=5693 RepID=A0A2V2VDA4_TRYCR|nr:hypothetical protein C4B63_26g1213c [Trypanosoma cruzi]RNF19418.1 hypothetical protein TcG_04571 [Trypanosoma cruzi]
MATQCVAECTGYRSLRADCARDPCLAEGMCKLLDAGITDCAEWCCVSRGGYVFFIVFFFSAGTCALLSMYYLWRLHRANVAAGAVTEMGEKIEAARASDAHATAEKLRKKRQVTVDPELFRTIGLPPPGEERSGVGGFR